MRPRSAGRFARRRTSGRSIDADPLFAGWGGGRDAGLADCCHEDTADGCHRLVRRGDRYPKRSANRSCSIRRQGGVGWNSGDLVTLGATSASVAEPPSQGRGGCDLADRAPSLRIGSSQMGSQRHGKLEPVWLAAVGRGFLVRHRGRRDSGGGRVLAGLLRRIAGRSRHSDNEHVALALALGSRSTGPSRPLARQAARRSGKRRILRPHRSNGAADR